MSAVSRQRTWEKIPAPDISDPTYYDLPLLHEPVWEWAIPLYYYVGGVSGASMALAAAAQLKSADAFDSLIQRCHRIGFVGTSLSSALLIWDLGRPSRFLNMLRVFRPTSAMNMGAWILSVSAGTAAATVVLPRRAGILRSVGHTLGFISGVFGLGLATYTGVLVGNSAIPVWQESRRVLPVLFGASAVASVGSLFDFFEHVEQRRVTVLFGNIGRSAEIAAGMAMERQAGRVPRVAHPLKRGINGLLWRTASLLTATSLVCSLLPNRTRAKRVAAGVLGTMGSLLIRFSVHHAGAISARDARASFHHQRAGHGGRE
ncbi:MAG: polysulfide reductase NrfD [Acidobacteriaceae bacterium]|nr:polysulfide reductase NrfD [Acidobacteriaceae bacterium]